MFNLKTAQHEREENYWATAVSHRTLPQHGSRHKVSGSPRRTSLAHREQVINEKWIMKKWIVCVLRAPSAEGPLFIVYRSFFISPMKANNALSLTYNWSPTEWKRGLLFCALTFCQTSSWTFLHQQRRIAIPQAYTRISEAIISFHIRGTVFPHPWHDIVTAVARYCHIRANIVP